MQETIKAIGQHVHELIQLAEAFEKTLGTWAENAKKLAAKEKYGKELDEKLAAQASLIAELEKKQAGIERNLAELRKQLG